MNNLSALREHMPMPDPSFPIKIHPRHTEKMEVGATLFCHHWHEHIEFLYFVSGEATIECGSVPFTFRAGDLCVVNSNELHYGISRSEDLSYYAMIVDISLLNSHASDAVEKKFITPIMQNRLLFQNRITDDPRVAACILAINEELASKTIGYELSVKSHLYQLLTLLVRHYAATAHEQDEYRARLKELERLAPVFAYIDEHAQEKLTVQQLAGLAGLSRFHFSRVFKQVTDKSLVEYVNLVRINKSESLLRDRHRTISEIALAAGFSDIYYFSRMFKKLKNVSPSEWRNGDR
ncbi:transcriptional regulator, AraC family [Paenibacillus curdlanolyticus YK9]|uniref:Transcriptional regulator, AraC family n=1 Tax=Paenibacillus curdlanolyticus YK9 TaxID=717606 RepID=E0IAA6_9BACL|nr:AraC family transcriptional regulator [Paenibacillus curdlanolyticus]EFM10683.1 transcriptional regulator, AraC family [Paenibacillus curdlanolyticus YK9]